MLTRSIMILILLASSSPSATVSVSQGLTLSPPAGYFAYNLDPTLNSSQIGPIYDPNFIPGFQVGLTNTSISWQMGTGFIRIGYQVGPWQYEQVQLPHLAVGPQCCNFHEIARTQQFRRPEWGDYYYVMAGFLAPAVNLPNYTATFTAPAYVGLRTDWEWVISLSLNWASPVMLKEENRWAAIGLAATEYVPDAPKKLVYTVLNFWMDSNSSKILGLAQDGASAYAVASSNVVVYHPLQLDGSGNLTITVDLSPYLEKTLHVLGLGGNETDPPVISYVYLNVEGYNFQWNTTLYSMFIMTTHTPITQTTASQSSFPAVYLLAPVITLIAVIVFFSARRRTLRKTG